MILATILVRLMKKKYGSYWKQTFQHSFKLSFHHNIKKNSSPSFYLDSARQNPLSRTLVQFRIACDNLRVETGRYDKIPLDARIGALYSGNRFKDETHLLPD